MRSSFSGAATTHPKHRHVNQCFVTKRLGRGDAAAAPYGCTSNAPTTNIIAEASHSSSTHTPARQTPVGPQEYPPEHSGGKGQGPQE